MGAAGRGKAQPCGRCAGCQGSAAPRLSAAWVSRRESSRGASARWWGRWPPLSCPCRGVGTQATWGRACQPPSRRKGASGAWFLKPERGSSGRWAPSPLLRRSRVYTHVEIPGKLSSNLSCLWSSGGIHSLSQVPSLPFIPIEG